MTTTPVLTRRRLVLGAGLAAGLATAGLAGCRTAPPPAAPVQPPRLRLLGETLLPHRQNFQGTTVGGLSGLDYDPASGLWVALSDDRSELQPARFYTLKIDIGPASIAVALTGVTTLRQADGTPFPPRRAGGEVVDPESIRFLPGGRGVLWTSEGDQRVEQHPRLREARLDGSHVRDLQAPAHFRYAGVRGSGAYDNSAFEGLALTPDGRGAWVAMEGPLQEDGPLPKVGEPGGPCRFTLFDLASGRPVRQVAYQPDGVPIAPAVPGTHADNGVSEILMLDAHRMLVLERAYALGTGVSLRLYEVDTREGGDTLALARLEPGRVQPLAKRLVANFADLGLSRLDNAECLAWGPRLPSGRRCLVVATDDNFNPMQVTQFAAFEFLE